MNSETGGYIFLCHASEDKATVAMLHGVLSRAGLRPWLDARDIPPASNWDRQIQSTLRASAVIIVCLSVQMLSKRGYVQRELELAVQLASQTAGAYPRLIIAKLDDCEVPAAFRTFDTVDLTTPARTAALVDAVKQAQQIYSDPRDGQLYRTVTLGGATWLAQNLNFDTPGSRWYGDQPRRAQPFGRLYTWAAAQVACPPGWHLPSEEEWEQLAITLGASWNMDKRLFDALIEGGSTGFDAVLGGLYDAGPPYPDCYELHQNGYYWAVGSGCSAVWFAFGGKMGGSCIRLDASNHDDAISCRCVLD